MGILTEIQEVFQTGSSKMFNVLIKLRGQVIPEKPTIFKQKRDK